MIPVLAHHPAGESAALEIAVPVLLVVSIVAVIALMRLGIVRARSRSADHRATEGGPDGA